MIRLAPPQLVATNPITPNPVRWAPRQRLQDVYLFLTEKDSLARCEHCGKRNQRRTTITTGFRINLKNPDRKIIFPRVSNSTWILCMPILSWLIATPSYQQTSGWCLVEQETSCDSDDFCPGNGWGKVEGRTGYRKFGRLRWVCLLIKSVVMPRSVIIVRHTST